jgi:hypothetical protein
MNVFLSLFFNLLPLYGLIALGWVAGRFLQVDRQSLGALAIYIFMPMTVFGFVVNQDFQASHILLPFVVYFISAVVGLGFLSLGKKVYGDSNANLMAMCVSQGNAGYFGLPLVMLFFTGEQIAIYVFMMLGGAVYEATIGYYIAARGQFDVRTSLIKIVKFPAIYAIGFALAVNASGQELPEIFWQYWAYFKGAYVVIGMMIVGAALSKVKTMVFGPRYIALAFTGKFIVYPLLAYCFVLVDRYWLHFFTSDIHQLVMVFAIVPPAANIAAFAAQLNLQPEKAATTVLVGTVIALFYIPMMIWLIGL